MLYVSSNSTADGASLIGVTFDLGTNLDIAQVQVQNRVRSRSRAACRRAQTSASPSPKPRRPDDGRASLFARQIARYPLHLEFATLEVKDPLTRIEGVVSITAFGSRDYSMRIWLDPDRLQSLGMTAGDVTLALQGQTSRSRPACSISRRSTSRVRSRLRSRPSGGLPIRGIRQYHRQADATAVVRLRDVRQGRACGARLHYEFLFGLDPAVALAIFQRPGSNALATANTIVPPWNNSPRASPRE